MNWLFVFSLLLVVFIIGTMAYGDIRRSRLRWLQAPKDRELAQQAGREFAEQRERDDWEFRSRGIERELKLAQHNLNMERKYFEAERERFRRLSLRLGLVVTADDEYAIPTIDRLYHPDIPGPAPIRKGDEHGSPHVCAWSFTEDGRVLDGRSAFECFLYPDKAERRRLEILADMPAPVDTRIRQAKYPNGRVVEFHMDKPETWPPELKSVEGRERPALPEPALQLGSLGDMAKGVEIVRMSGVEGALRRASDALRQDLSQEEVEQVGQQMMSEIDEACRSGVPMPTLDMNKFDQAREELGREINEAAEKRDGSE